VDKKVACVDTCTIGCFNLFCSGITLNPTKRLHSLFTKTLVSMINRLHSILLSPLVFVLLASCAQNPSVPQASTSSGDGPSSASTGTPTSLPLEEGPTPVEKDSISSPYSLITTPPDRDIVDINRRLRPNYLGNKDLDLANVEPHLTLGSSSLFWVVDPIDKSAVQITAALTDISEHAYWYFEEAFIPDPEDLAQAINAFESDIYPSVTQAFGREWLPGIDNDPKLTILHTDLGYIDGYYRSTDEYPKNVQRLSNEREMIYINLRRIELGTPAHGAVLAHELQHVVHWASDPSEETWVNEGMSEVAKAIAGYGFPSKDYFLADPSISLNNWPSAMQSQLPYYGGSALFMEYLVQHYGGYKNIDVLLGTESDGIAGINDYLRASGYDDTFDHIFNNWLTSTYLDSWGLPSYSYDRIDTQIDPEPLKASTSEHTGTIQQYAGEYLEINDHKGDVVLHFQGHPQVPIIPIDPREGSTCWWGNHGDSIDSSMTAPFDLSGVSTATLNFWIWYAIEESWDYTYVQVSRDGGKSWDILLGTHMSANNPVGPDLGPGYTGESKIWLQESIDLTPYVGEFILLRFEYITDETINDTGVCIDDISIPEIGFFDEPEAPSSWSTSGFIPINNLLPQLYSVQIIEIGKSVAIKPMHIGEDGTGSIEISGLGDTLDKAVIVIAAVNPDTKQPNSYTLYITDNG